jgi:hypothetical protein
MPTMNDRIRLYIDETKGFKNNFFIHSCVFANPSNCDAFESDLIKIISDNRPILGVDFKGFHSNRLSNSNWNKLSPIYEKVIQSIFNNKLGVHMYLESKNKYDKNSGLLKNWLKTELENETSKVHKAFSNLKQEDYPVLYNRFEMIYIFLIHKDKYGQNCEFEIYPDSSGKVLDYKTKTIELTSSNNLRSKTFDFYDTFGLLVNAFIDTFDAIKYLPNNNQKVIKYSPTNDSDCFLIQACDIVSNFLFNYIRYHSGIIDKNSKLKADLFSKYFLLIDDDSFMKNNFSVVNNNAFCINPKMKINIIKQESTFSL